MRSGQDVGKGHRLFRDRQRRRQMRQNLPAKRPAAGGYRLPLAGAIPVDHPGKAVLFGQGTNLLALAHHLQPRTLPGEDFHRVPDVLPHLHGVAPRLQHVAISVPGGAGVVKGCEVEKGYRQMEALPLPRRKQLTLLKGAENLPRISQLALGQDQIGLGDGLARRLALVFHVHGEGNAAACRLPGSCEGKGGVAQAEAKGKEHLPRGKGFKIPVAHIDVLLIGVGGAMAKGSRGGVVVIVPGNGI